MTNPSFNIPVDDNGFPLERASLERAKFVITPSNEIATRVYGIAAVGSAGTFSDYKTNDLDTAGTTQYVGQAIPNSDIWLITKIVTTVDDYTLAYANVSNNASYLTYSTAWAARASLAYSAIKDLTFASQPGSTPTSSNPLPVVLYDSHGHPVTMDEDAGSLLTMDETHYMIHQGLAYVSGFGWQAVGTGVNKYFLLETNSLHEIHLRYSVEFTGQCQFGFYEEPTWSGAVGGTPMTPTNMNRVSANVSDVIQYFNTNTPTTLGTIIVAGTFGSGRTIGGSTSNLVEFILKPNTKYLFKFTPGANNIDIVLSLNWYEIA